MGAYQDLARPVPDSDALMRSCCAAGGGRRPDQPPGRACRAHARRPRRRSRCCASSTSRCRTTLARGCCRRPPAGRLPRPARDAHARSAVDGHGAPRAVGAARRHLGRASRASTSSTRSGPTAAASTAHWADDMLDCEYTYYGLLALGHLSLLNVVAISDRRALAPAPVRAARLARVRPRRCCGAPPTATGKAGCRAARSRRPRPSSPSRRLACDTTPERSHARTTRSRSSLRSRPQLVAPARRG